MPFKTIPGASLAARFPKPQESFCPPDLRGRVEIAPLETPMRFVLPMPPSANRYWRNVDGIMRRSAEAKAYKIAVEKTMQDAGFVALKGPVRLTLRVFRAQKSGDLDNRIKVAQDSLNGICWIDDKQVVEIHAFRYDDAQNPRVEVEVWEVPDG